MNVIYYITKFIIILSFAFSVFSKLEPEDITVDRVNKILDDSFSSDKNDLLQSKNNVLKIFRKSKRIFEIISEGVSIEKDYSINFNSNVFVKYYTEKDLENEYIFIEANQLYYNKLDNVIIFLGNVHVKMYENDTDLYSECIIYDINSDVFYNTHKNNITMKNVEIEGDNLYLKRDLSRFLLENIRMSNFMFNS